MWIFTVPLYFCYYFFSHNWPGDDGHGSSWLTPNLSDERMIHKLIFLSSLKHSSYSFFAVHTHRLSQYVVLTWRGERLVRILWSNSPFSSKCRCNYYRNQNEAKTVTKLKALYLFFSSFFLQYWNKISFVVCEKKPVVCCASTYKAFLLIVNLQVAHFYITVTVFLPESFEMCSWTGC